MNRKHTCTDCQTRIPVGMAVLRGNGRAVEAWHRNCWELRQEVVEFLPAAAA